MKPRFFPSRKVCSIGSKCWTELEIKRHIDLLSVARLLQSPGVVHRYTLMKSQAQLDLLRYSTQSREHPEMWTFLVGGSSL